MYDYVMSRSRSKSAFDAHVARQQRARSLERRRRAAKKHQSPHKSPDRSPNQSPQPCPSGKVRNPASGRCVKPDSRALLFSGYYNGGVPLDFLDCPAGKVYSALSGRCVSAARAAKGSPAPSPSPTPAPRRRARAPKPLDPTRKNFAVRRAQQLLNSKHTLSPSNVAFIEGALRRPSPSPSPSRQSYAKAAEIFAAASPERQRALLGTAIQLMESGRALSPEEATFVQNMSRLFS